MRYDKRTLVHPQSFDDSSTVQQETIDDAMMAAITLQSFKEVDMNKIYILGHSLGGMMIPRIYSVTPEAYGFIMMAAPVTPIHELMVEQYEYIYNLDGKKSINERFSLRNYQKCVTT
jgi:predicted peptidase